MTLIRKGQARIVAVVLNLKVERAVRAAKAAKVAVAAKAPIRAKVRPGASRLRKEKQRHMQMAANSLNDHVVALLMGGIEEVLVV